VAEPDPNPHVSAGGESSRLFCFCFEVDDSGGIVESGKNSKLEVLLSILLGLYQCLIHPQPAPAKNTVLSQSIEPPNLNVPRLQAEARRIGILRFLLIQRLSIESVWLEVDRNHNRNQVSPSINLR
jgi:hypothetical protein